jgi:hypothetical protein
MLPMEGIWNMRLSKKLQTICNPGVFNPGVYEWLNQRKPCNGRNIILFHNTTD